MKLIDKGYYIQGTKSIVTIGKFDGLHTGHETIFDKVMSMKKDTLNTIVVSFENHPDKLLTGNAKLLLSDDDKRERLESIGFDYFCRLAFDDELMNTEAEEFFRSYIVCRWNASILVVGDDFCFGKNRKGDLKLLKCMCRDNGIELIVVERKLYEEIPVSSSRIKDMLIKGRLKAAEKMLGYKYFFKGEIVSGNRIGNTIGFPTINILPDVNCLIPKLGVYATEVTIDGMTYKGITNIGVKPTVGEDEALTIETNILDFNKDVYGHQAKVSLISFLREEKKFSSLNELKKQIENDKKYWTNGE